MREAGVVDSAQFPHRTTVIHVITGEASPEGVHPHEVGLPRQGPQETKQLDRQKEQVHLPADSKTEDGEGCPWSGGCTRCTLTGGTGEVKRGQSGNDVFMKVLIGSYMDEPVISP